MMIKYNCEKVGIQKALERFGGFVRYFDTTEPLAELVNIVSSGSCKNILACCGGGDQALTMIGAASQARSLCAVDINAAQLFCWQRKPIF